jgi:hypothetical protein
MTAEEEFIERVDRLEARYKGCKYATGYMMPAELMKRLRDELKEKEDNKNEQQQKLF